MKQKLATAVLLMFVMIIVAGILWYSNIGKNNTDVVMILNNIDADKTIAYSVKTDGFEVMQGTLIPDNDNKSIIKSNDITRDKRAAQKTISYDIDITDKQNKTQYIEIILDKKNETVAVKGKNLDPLSTLSIASYHEAIEFKADWAGQLHSEFDYAFHKRNAKKSSHGFSLAFIDSRTIKSGVQIKSPIIQVFVADDQNGFVTGGDAPIHSWTNGNQANPHTFIFEVNTEGNEDEEDEDARNNLNGVVYREQYCGRPNISVCERKMMGGSGGKEGQIHKIVSNYVRAMMLMTEQFSAVGMEYVQAIGMFFDAKDYLETEREIQVRMAKAHKDYHPSVQMCRFGTFARSIADSEQRMYQNKLAMNDILMSHYTARRNSVTTKGYTVDIEERLRQFKKTFCDPKSNHEDGLTKMCKSPGQGIPPEDPAVINDNDQPETNAKDRTNSDVDYTRIVDAPLTLPVNFVSTVDEKQVKRFKEFTAAEEDVIALARNLYWPRALTVEAEDDVAKKKDDYSELRAATARNNIAHQSFAHLVGMKAEAERVPKQGEGTKPNQAEEPDMGWYYMKELMQEFGLGEKDANRLLGKYPSYYAQMEVLTKLIYQDPDFYTHLYDKPTNVKRVGTALDAVKLMHGWDRFEASLRREMLTSMLVEQALDKHVSAINGKIDKMNSRLRTERTQ